MWMATTAGNSMSAQTYFLKRTGVPLSSSTPRDVAYIAWNAEENASRFIYLDINMMPIALPFALRIVEGIDDFMRFAENTRTHWESCHPVDEGL